MTRSTSTDYQPGQVIERYVVLRDGEPKRSGRVIQMRCTICGDVSKADRKSLLTGTLPRCSCTRKRGT